uniref:Uncharacterized protein n=1 Tax=Kalanchoe fedtschenkoi TaxID=63787 RepID=A0A7N0ZT42_KALFE
MKSESNNHCVSCCYCCRAMLVSLFSDFNNLIVCVCATVPGDYYHWRSAYCGDHKLRIDFYHWLSNVPQALQI